MLRKKEKAQTLRKRKGFNFSSLFSVLIVFFSLSISNIYYNQAATAQEVNQKQEQGSSNKELDNIEEKVFHQNYKKESEEDRLSRLERFLFGEVDIKNPIDRRVKRVSTVLNIQKEEEPEIKAEPLGEIKPEIVNDAPPPKPDKEGIIGAISQIETKLFNMTFNDYPFQARINALEDRLLSKGEILANRTKPLLERVTILVSKAGLQVPKDDMINLPVTNTNTEAINPPSNEPKSYSINPNTGQLINEQTGEVVKDSDGNPIFVMVPQPLTQQQIPQQNGYLPQQQNYGYMPPQQNYGYLPQQQYQNNPYGQQNQFPGQIPYDLLFNQAGGTTDPGY